MARFIVAKFDAFEKKNMRSDTGLIFALNYSFVEIIKNKAKNRLDLAICNGFVELPAHHTDHLLGCSISGSVGNITRRLRIKTSGVSALIE